MAKGIAEKLNKLHAEREKGAESVTEATEFVN
jgi:hypothetical protein